jgi:hypothetical protein
LKEFELSVRFSVVYAQRHESTRDRRKIQAGTGGHDDRVPERQFLGLRFVLSDHRLFRGVPDGTHRRAGSYVSGGLSCSTTASMAYGLGNLSNRHLERAALVDDHKGSHRRACLPLADSRDVRLAVAALNKELRPTRRRHTQSATLAAERSF